MLGRLFKVYGRRETHGNLWLNGGATLTITPPLALLPMSWSTANLLHYIFPYVFGDINVEAVDRSLKAREECIQVLKYHLAKAHQRMKQQADKHRYERILAIGNLAYVKL